MSLWSHLRRIDSRSNSFLWGLGPGIALAGLVHGSSLSVPPERFRGRSVLLATKQQLPTAVALIELDGIARSLVLCPADLSSAQIQLVAASVPADALVSDREDVLAAACPSIDLRATWRREPNPVTGDRAARETTKWILLTSGTTGLPKMVAHTLATLTGAIQSGPPPAVPGVWSTFYDIRRYGGLQIFLRAILAGESLVLSESEESLADFLIRAGAHGVTHISGTPSHWRRALMSPAARNIDPRHVRLSGEVADQAILDRLRCCYPDAAIVHAFASTEAGVAFDVRDGLAGFPAALVDDASRDVQMKVVDGSLRIRSARVSPGYIGPDAERIQDADGFVDTRDMVERRGDRYYFTGRRDGVINVGGLKVQPEEVEAVINQHPQVQMSLVRTKKSPITGAVVVADIVLGGEPDAETDRTALQNEILELCRQALPRHKVPAAANFVNNLAVAASGKLVR